MEGTMFLVLSFLSIIEACFHKHPFARYEKTRIIDFKCDKSRFIKTVQTRNIYNCGLICNEVTDCRRYLFCKTQSECKLYGDGTDCIFDGDATGCHCFRKLIDCNGMKITCPWGLYGDTCEHIVNDCQDAKLKGQTSPKSVITRIKPVSAPEAFDVECWFGNPATFFILNRNKQCSTVDFNRTFQEYKEGFGMVPWDSWLGFDKILQILNSQKTFTLIVRLVKDNRGACAIHYNNFTLGNASTHYRFQTSTNYASNHLTCGDSMTGSNNTLDLRGRPFSTYDQDGTSTECAAKLGGGWWFADHPNCSDGFLMAKEYDENFWKNYFWGPNMKNIGMKLAHSKVI